VKDFSEILPTIDKIMEEESVNTLGKRLNSLTIIFVLTTVILGSCASPTAAPATEPPAAVPTDVPATAPAAAEPKTLVIGEIETLTGASSDNLKLAASGAYLAQQYVNNHGGITINGEVYMVDILLEDNKGTADGASAAATKLISDDHVMFVTGSGPPPLTNAIGAVAEPAGVLYASIYSNGTKNEQNPDRKFTFIANPDSFAGQISAMTYLKVLHPEVRTIAYVLIDDGQIADNDAQVRASASALGLEIVGDIIGFAPPTVDFTPIAQKAFERGADAVMFGNGSPDYMGQMLKNLRTMGFTGPIFVCSMTPPQDIMKIAGPEASTNFFGHGISDLVEVPDLPEITAEVIAMAVADSDIGRFDMMMAQGFDAIYTMVQAIENAQSLDPQVVATEWAKMTTIDTVFGPGKMGGLQTYGINHSVYTKLPILRLENNVLSWGTWEETYLP
jgi:ABC-type branched-subunit amino acid transport system substrate-binding protein